MLVPRRLILHMSFCGSTQLAHLIDASGAAMVLEEPQALVDLADWHRVFREPKLDDARFAPALAAVMALLGRCWDDGGPTALKPPNWANSLIPALLDLPGQARVVSPGERFFAPRFAAGARQGR